LIHLFDIKTAKLKAYSQWTMAGMLDLEEELKVAEEFWDFLGRKGAYQDVLDCFEKVGMELRGEIDSFFAKFHNTDSIS